MNGTDSADTLYGGIGNDRILAGKGNDKLFGEEGDDYLEGGAGNDTYIVSFGKDTLSDNEGNSIIIVDSEVSFDNIKIERTNWNDLTVSYSEENSFKILGFFVSEENRNYTVKLKDGTVFTLQLTEDGSDAMVVLKE